MEEVEEVAEVLPQLLRDRVALGQGEGEALKEAESVPLPLGEPDGDRDTVLLELPVEEAELLEQWVGLGDMDLDSETVAQRDSVTLAENEPEALKQPEGVKELLPETEAEEDTLLLRVGLTVVDVEGDKELVGLAEKEPEFVKELVTVRDPEGLPVLLTEELKMPVEVTEWLSEAELH